MIDNFDVIYTDLDGTLLEDRYRHYQCYCDIVTKYGGLPISLEEYWNDKRNRVKRTVLLEKTGFGGTYDDFFQEWIARIEQKEYLQYELLKPQIREVLSFLREHTGKLLLVSMRNSRENLLWQLRQLKIDKFFDGIYSGSALAGCKKTDLIDAEQEGKRLLVIGDTEDDMELSHKLNGRFLAVTNGLREKRFLVADDYVEELYEIL